jgi:hypothetical protein
MIERERGSLLGNVTISGTRVVALYSVEPLNQVSCSANGEPGAP